MVQKIKPFFFPSSLLKAGLEHSVCCKPRALGNEGGWGQTNKIHQPVPRPHTIGYKSCFQSYRISSFLPCHSCQPLPLARRWMTQVWARTWQGDTKPEGLQAGSSKKGHLLKQFVYRQPSRDGDSILLSLANPDKNTYWTRQRSNRTYHSGFITLKHFWEVQVEDMTPLQCLNYVT